MIESWRVENIVTLVCTTVLILGLFWMSHSWWAFGGLSLLLNINYQGRANGK